MGKHNDMEAKKKCQSANNEQPQAKLSYDFEQVSRSLIDKLSQQIEDRDRIRYGQVRRKFISKHNKISQPLQKQIVVSSSQTQSQPAGKDNTQIGRSNAVRVNPQVISLSNTVLALHTGCIQETLSVDRRVNLFGLSIYQLVILFISEIWPVWQLLACPHCSNKFAKPQGYSDNEEQYPQSCEPAAQVSQDCHSGSTLSTVHKKIMLNPCIQEQLRLLMQMLAGSFNPSLHFQEERLAIMGRLAARQPSIFTTDFVTAFEHRAICMLLKRTHHEKYTFSPVKHELRGQGMSPQPGGLCGRPAVVEQFYQQQYGKKVEVYYRELLEIELEAKRYVVSWGRAEDSHVIETTMVSVPASNFVRLLMHEVFGEKIKGQGLERQQIQGLQTKIQVSTIAFEYLRKASNPQDNHQKVSPARPQIDSMFEQKQIGSKEQTDYQKRGRPLSEYQKKVIEYSLQSYRRNLPVVPFPECMFIDYRLQAQRAGHIATAKEFKIYEQPSKQLQQQGLRQQGQVSDDGLLNMRKVQTDRKRFNDLNVYKGYVGIKTTAAIQRNRRLKKNIDNSAKRFTQEGQQIFHNSRSKNIEPFKQEGTTKNNSKNAEVIQLD